MISEELFEFLYLQDQKTHRRREKDLGANLTRNGLIGISKKIDFRLLIWKNQLLMMSVFLGPSKKTLITLYKIFVLKCWTWQNSQIIKYQIQLMLVPQ